MKSKGTTKLAPNFVSVNKTYPRDRRVLATLSYPPCSVQPLEEPVQAEGTVVKSEDLLWHQKGSKGTGVAFTPPEFTHYFCLLLTQAEFDIAALLPHTFHKNKLITEASSHCV